MAFLDTNVLLSYAFVNDPQHDKAKELIEEVKRYGRLFISPISIFEIYCVIPRKIVGGSRLPRPLQKKLEKIPQLEERLKESIEMVISYLKGELNLKLCSDKEIPEISQLGEVLIAGERLKLLKPYLIGIQRSYRLGLKALDMLQVTYIYEYARKSYPSYLATLDSKIKDRANAIRQELGIEILYK